ncbi:hypothetical protein, partial [Streptomyces sp. AC154]|uniref:hypothetical protein n=1 Tax=Streptomyces sp. AC154 TaxID=3143184 RepID=UPI003F809E32
MAARVVSVIRRKAMWLSVSMRWHAACACAVCRWTLSTAVYQLPSAAGSAPGAGSGSGCHGADTVPCFDGCGGWTG